MPTPKIAAEYIGKDGEHLSNIPASDLTEADMDALSEDRREALLANAAGDHAIYKLHGRDLKAEAKEAAAEDAITETIADIGPPASADVKVPAPAKAESKK
jgi:hypothetical protein